MLGPGQLETYVAPNGPVETGRWIVAHDELLNCPYPHSELLAGETRAPMTRLRSLAAGVRSQLNLHFASGMELQPGQL